MASKRARRLILAGGTGIAAVTFHGVFLSGCGSVNPCFGRDGGICEPIDTGISDGRTDGAGDAADASTDAGSDARDASGDAPADAPDGG